MKYIALLLLLVTSLQLGANESDSTKYDIQIIDYSLSWISSTHFCFNDEEIKIYEVDNTDTTQQTVFVHRQLLGREKDIIRQYLDVFITIKLGDQYIERKYAERNQKRLAVRYKGEEKNIFVSNTFQHDIAGLVTFLNSFIPEKFRMKEFSDPNPPKKKQLIDIASDI